jgi:hypothetical protein
MIVIEILILVVQMLVIGIKILYQTHSHEVPLTKPS